jgi:Velvet factor
MDSSYSSSHGYILQVSLVDVSGQHDRMLVMAKSRRERGSTERESKTTLLGSVVSNCRILHGLDGQEEMMFVFADLRVCISGDYRLKFTLLDLHSR